MSEQPSRRNFLKFLGAFAGTTMISSNAFAGFVREEEIKKLNPEQKEFMLRYGKWMDEFIEVIRVQRAEPDNMENHRRMIVLTDEAEKLNTELAVFMSDPTFSMIYNVSIQRMTDEIK
jgi:hypothetical protein